MSTAWNLQHLAVAGITLLIAAALLTGLTGCKTSRISDRDLAFVDVAEAPTILAPRSGALGIGKSEPGVYVDPRTEQQYQQGHIPGAVSLPYQHVSLRHQQLRPYASIVVYGDNYGDPKAEGMAKRLIELGHEEVYILRGGLRAWKQAGNDVETEE